MGTMSRHESFSRVNQGSDEPQEVSVALQEKLWEDFEEFVQEVPPIEGDFSGDPRDILQLPREQRKEALTDFKDKVVRQRWAFARCRQYIEDIIGLGYGVALKRLSGIVDRFAGLYAFSDVQRKIFEDVIAVYHKGRSFALTMRKRFPNDVDLVNELTGQHFDRDAPFTVSVGSFGLEIQIGSKYFDILDEHAIGFVQMYTHNDEVFYSIIVDSDLDDTEKEHTIRHEQEHIKHSYFMAVLNRCLAEKDFKRLFGCFWNPSFVVAMYRKDASLGSIQSALLGLQRYVLMEVKDEFFAMVYSEPLPLTQENVVNLFSRDGGIYDFLSADVLYFRDECKGDNDFLSLVDTVLVRDYRDILVRAFQSFFDLLDVLVKKNRYTRESQAFPEAVALLTDVPMQDWKKMVDRLLEQERGSS